MAETRKPALVAGSSGSAGTALVGATATGGSGWLRSAARFFAMLNAARRPTPPKARIRTAMVVQTIVLRETEGSSGGAARSNSVGWPQWGQSVVIPTESAGNSIWPPQWLHSPFKYFIPLIFWH